MQKIANTLDRFNERVGELTAWILIALSALIIYDAVMRYLFSGGSIMLQELEWHLFDLIILFSISYTLKYNRHVRVDIFYHNFSKERQALINRIGYIFMVIPFSLLVIYVGLSFVQMSFVQMEGSANPGGLPYRYLIKGVMVLGFVFLILQAVAELFKGESA